MQPNRRSELFVGEDHLSYFALLGRIVGLALFHGENIPAPWSNAFIKATFDFPIGVSDLESADPDLYNGYVKHIQDGEYGWFGLGIASITALQLQFEADDCDEYVCRAFVVLLLLMHYRLPLQLSSPNAGRTLTFFCLLRWMHRTCTIDDAKIEGTLTIR